MKINYTSVALRHFGIRWSSLLAILATLGVQMVLFVYLNGQTNLEIKEIRKDVKNIDLRLSRLEISVKHIEQFIYERGWTSNKRKVSSSTRTT